MFFSLMCFRALTRPRWKMSYLKRRNFGEFGELPKKFAKFAKISSRQIAKINSRQI